MHYIFINSFWNIRKKWYSSILATVVYNDHLCFFLKKWWHDPIWYTYSCIPNYPFTISYAHYNRITISQYKMCIVVSLQQQIATTWTSCSQYEPFKNMLTMLCKIWKYVLNLVNHGMPMVFNNNILVLSYLTTNNTILLLLYQMTINFLLLFKNLIFFRQYEFILYFFIGPK